MNSVERVKSYILHFSIIMKKKRDSNAISTVNSLIANSPSIPCNKMEHVAISPVSFNLMRIAVPGPAYGIH